MCGLDQALTGGTGRPLHSFSRQQACDRITKPKDRPIIIAIIINMQPPAPFVFDTPRQRRRSTIFSNVALSFIAPVFLFVCLLADYLDTDRRLGVEAATVKGGLGLGSLLQSGGAALGGDNDPIRRQQRLDARIAAFTHADARAAVDAAMPAGLAVPLTLSRARSHRTTWGVLRHAFRPLLPALWRAAALEEDGESLVAMHAGRPFGRADDDNGGSRGRPANRSSARHRALQTTGEGGKVQLHDLADSQYIGVVSLGTPPQVRVYVCICASHHP